MVLFGFGKKLTLPTVREALPGRSEKMPVPSTHYVNGHPLQPPFPAGMETAIFGLGCFWGAERKFWQLEGVYTTAVGYAAGITPNPTYQEVCTGMTGHNEVVLVVYDPSVISYEQLLKVFWESPGIYTYSPQQKQLAEKSRSMYQEALNQAGYSQITTEILDAPEFYYAEVYHQQYLAKNPGGYCGLGGTKVECPIALDLKLT